MDASAKGLRVLVTAGAAGIGRVVSELPRSRNV
jgi:hypothetical protein